MRHGWVVLVSLLYLINANYAAHHSFFHITDIHYDPLSNPEKYNASTFCRSDFDFDYDKFRDHLKHDLRDEVWSTPGDFGRYGCDTNQNLLSSVLSAMSLVNAKPDFIIFTGDAAAHALSDQSDQLQAIGHVANSLQNTFPGTTIIPAIGNNDVYPDYTVSCDDPNLSRLYAAYEKFIPFNQSLSFFKMGSFTVSPQTGLRVVSINTVLYSTKNSPGLGVDPCGQFAWLRGVLTESRSGGEKVYIIGHIVPGLDPDLFEPMWYPDYSDQFVQIILDYSDIIYGSFFGHMHRDEFRILATSQASKNGKGTALNASLLAAPSVSPIYDNNPSFRQYYYNSTFDITDYDQYYTDLFMSNMVGVTNWTIEYSFGNSYKVNSVSTVALVDVFARLKNDPILFSQWYDRRVGQYVDSKQTALCVLNSHDVSTFNACIAAGAGIV